MVSVDRFHDGTNARASSVAALQKTSSAHGTVDTCPDAFKYVLKDLGIFPKIMDLPG